MTCQPQVVAAEVASPQTPPPPLKAAAPAPAAAAASEPEETCPVCMEVPETRGGPVEWPAGCGHKFCSTCCTACLNRSLHCPMCRAEAPESAKPPQSRMDVVLTMFQLVRLEEMQRLRAEREAASATIQPRSRVGRWVHQKWDAWGRYVDSILGLD